jgi:hypothetical protein
MRRRRARFSAPLPVRLRAWSTARQLIATQSMRGVVHGNVQHPVQAVLDAPVGASDLKKARRFQGRAEQEVAGLTGLLAVNFARVCHLADGTEARPVVAILQPADIG